MGTDFVLGLSATWTEAVHLLVKLVLYQTLDLLPLCNLFALVFDLTFELFDFYSEIRNSTFLNRGYCRGRQTAAEVRKVVVDKWHKSPFSLRWWRIDIGVSKL